MAGSVSVGALVITGWFIDTAVTCYISGVAGDLTSCAKLLIQEYDSSKMIAPVQFWHYHYYYFTDK